MKNSHSDVILLMASQDGVSNSSFDKTSDRMICLFDRVQERGHRMFFLGPDGNSILSGGMRSVLQDVEARHPGSVLLLTLSSSADEYAIRWPRDCLHQIGGFVALAEGTVPDQIVRLLGIQPARISPLCEGGLFLQMGDVLLSSSAVPQCAELKSIRRALKTHDIPHPYTSSRYWLDCDPGLPELTHIDLDCSLLRASSGQLLLLVGERYYQAYENEVRVVCEALNACLLVVPQEEVELRMLNLIHLPPLDVILPAGSVVVREFLRRHIGEEHLIEVKIDEHFGYNGGLGGLRCMSSVLMGNVG